MFSIYPESQYLVVETLLEKLGVILKISERQMDSLLCFCTTTRFRDTLVLELKIRSCRLV